MNKYKHIGKIKRFMEPHSNYMIEIVENKNDIESWLTEINSSIKLFCYGIPKNSENKNQIMELLEITQNDIRLFKQEYEIIKEKIEQEP